MEKKKIIEEVGKKAIEIASRWLIDNCFAISKQLGQKIFDKLINEILNQKRLTVENIFLLGASGLDLNYLFGFSDTETNIIGDFVKRQTESLYGVVSQNEVKL